MKPMNLLRANEYIEKFEKNHTRVFPFLKDAGGKITEGTVIEVRVIFPEGNEICSNIRVTESDMEMVRELRESSGK